MNLDEFFHVTSYARDNFFKYLLVSLLNTINLSDNIKVEEFVIIFLIKCRLSGNKIMRNRLQIMFDKIIRDRSHESDPALDLRDCSF